MEVDRKTIYINGGFSSKPYVTGLALGHSMSLRILKGEGHLDVSDGELAHPLLVFSNPGF
jgi:hypothetical protein